MSKDRNPVEEDEGVQEVQQEKEATKTKAGVHLLGQTWGAKEGKVGSAAIACRRRVARGV